MNGKVRRVLICAAAAAMVGLAVWGWASPLMGGPVDEVSAQLETEIANSAPVGQLRLTAEGIEQRNPARLLINGSAVRAIDAGAFVLDIPDGAVVEIDAVGLSSPVTVCVAGKSERVLTDCVGRSVTARDDIVSLGAFVVDHP